MRASGGEEELGFKLLGLLIAKVTFSLPFLLTKADCARIKVPASVRCCCSAVELLMSDDGRRTRKNSPEDVIYHL